MRSLEELLARPQATAGIPLAPREITSGGDRAGRGALASECGRVAAAVPGERDDVLNKAAYRMGQLVAAGHLDLETVVAELTVAGISTGQSAGEVARALRTDETGALTQGMGNPRQLEPRDVGPGPLTTWTPPSLPVVDEDAHPDEYAAAVREQFPIVDWHAVWADESVEEWLLEPLIPARRLVALYSPPKVGKSLLMLEVAASLAAGRTVLGIVDPRPVRTLYVDFENDVRGDVRSRLIALGFGPTDLENLAYQTFPSFRAFDSPAGGAQLLAVAKAYGAELVVIDTISRAITGEENANDTWLSFYRNTGAPLKAAGIAVVRLDHSGKDVERGMRGGSAKYSDVDAVWQLSEVEPDKTFKLLCTDNRFPIAEKELIIRRETTPRLHHRVDPTGTYGVFVDKLAKVTAKLDELDVSPATGVRGAADALRDVGFTAGQGVVASAQKNRRARIPESDE